LKIELEMYGGHLWSFMTEVNFAFGSFKSFSTCFDLFNCNVLRVGPFWIYINEWSKNCIISLAFNKRLSRFQDECFTFKAIYILFIHIEEVGSDGQCGS
jgi:hypothetical protein